MKKTMIMVAIIAIAMLGFIGTAAQAERYFTGNLVNQVPGETVNFAHKMCADFSSFSNGGKVSFTLDTCDPAFEFGFTGDNRVVVSVKKDEKQAYIISRDSARGLRNEVEHSGITATAQENLKVSQDTNALVTALAQNAAQNDRNKVAANNYRSEAVASGRKKLGTANTITKGEAFGKLYYTFRPGLDQNVRDRGNAKVETIAGVVKAFTGADYDRISANANIASIEGDCVADGDCRQ